MAGLNLFAATIIYWNIDHLASRAPSHTTKTRRIQPSNQNFWRPSPPQMRSK